MSREKKLIKPDGVEVTITTDENDIITTEK